MTLEKIPWLITTKVTSTVRKSRIHVAWFTVHRSTSWANQTAFPYYMTWTVHIKLYSIYFRFCLSAPIIHYFYIFLEKIQPRKEKPSQIDNIKRLLIDRFLFTPPFILLFLYVVTILEVTFLSLFFSLFLFSLLGVSCLCAKNKLENLITSNWG
jgi:hypothetical protein